MGLPSLSTFTETPLGNWRYSTPDTHTDEYPVRYALALEQLPHPDRPARTANDTNNRMGPP